jgi:hypothetical protein
MASLVTTGERPEVQTTPPTLERALGKPPKRNGLPAPVCRCAGGGPMVFAPVENHCARCGRDVTRDYREYASAIERDGLRLLDAAIEAERLRLRLQAEHAGHDWGDVVREYRELTEGGWS